MNADSAKNILALITSDRLDFKGSELAPMNAMCNALMMVADGRLICVKPPKDGEKDPPEKGRKNPKNGDDDPPKELNPSPKG